MTREELFESKRGEREGYESCELFDSVNIPVTRDGFEALIETVGRLEGLPVDDQAKSAIAAYFHHMDRETDSVTLDVLGSVLRKNLCNQLTWIIGSEIKQKMELEAANTAAAASKEPDAQEPI